MKALIIILSLCPMLAFGQSFEFGLSGGVSTTSNPGIKFNSLYYQKESVAGGVFVPAISAQALFNINGFFQTGIVADYYGLKGWYSNSAGVERKYTISKAQANVLVELNATTGGKKSYFYMGGAAGIDNSMQFVWGGQSGFLYKPISHLGVFLQGSVRKITVDATSSQTVSFFTFPITVGVRVLL